MKEIYKINTKVELPKVVVKEDKVVKEEEDKVEEVVKEEVIKDEKRKRLKKLNIMCKIIIVTK